MEDANTNVFHLPHIFYSISSRISKLSIIILKIPMDTSKLLVKPVMGLASLVSVDETVKLTLVCDHSNESYNVLSNIFMWYCLLQYMYAIQGGSNF